MTGAIIAIIVIAAIIILILIGVYIYFSAKQDTDVRMAYLQMHIEQEKRRKKEMEDALKEAAEKGEGERVKALEAKIAELEAKLGDKAKSAEAPKEEGDGENIEETDRAK